MSGFLRVPVVLLPQRDDDFIDQGLAQPRNLHPWATLYTSTLISNNRRLATVRRGPDADDRAGVVRIGGVGAIARQIGFGHLDGHTVNVEILGAIDPGGSRPGHL